METYQVLKDMQLDAERKAVALAVGGSVELFEQFADELANTYAKDQSEDERNKVKEYFRRKVLATKYGENEWYGSLLIGAVK